MGQLDKAITDFSKAIELNPKDADAIYNRGNAYRIKGQFDKAISDYNKAVELNPRFANLTGIGELPITAKASTTRQSSIWTRS